MNALEFAVLDARPEPYAAVPTILLRLRVTHPDGLPVHAAALRVQVRIEPRRRRYDADDQVRLVELFGEPGQWGDSLNPFLWTHADTTLTAFTGSTEVDLPITCTYDLEVAATRYFHALGDDGTVPVVLLFSGMTFTQGETGLQVAPIAWHADASYDLPVAVWRTTMDQAFPNSGWLRLSRPTLDALAAYKATHALPTWEHAIDRLLQDGDPTP